MADMHIGYLIKQVFLMNQARLNTGYGWIGYIHCILNVLLMYLLSAFMSLKQVNQREGLGSRQIKFRKYGIQSGLIH